MKISFIKYVGVFVLGILVGALLAPFVLPHADTVSKGVMSGEIQKLRTGASGPVDLKKARYVNEFYGFTLEYPIEFTQKEFDEGNNAMTIVFQKPNEEKGFQVFIVPYTAEQISNERIKGDLNGQPLNNPVEVIVPGNIRAVHFESESATLGPTSEVWFIHGGYLFEVTTYKPLDGMLAEVIQSLTFTK